MMNKYELEVLKVGGKALLDFVAPNFEPGSYSIIARDDEMIVLGDKTKNIKFSRLKMKILEKFTLEATKPNVNRK